MALIGALAVGGCTGDDSVVREPGSYPEMLQDHGAGEGPAWHPTLGLLTSSGGNIYRRRLDGAVTIYRKGAGSNGLMFTPEGRLLERIPIPRDECTNCTFGGVDSKTLFVTAGGSLWSVRVRVPGQAAGTARRPLVAPAPSRQ